MNRDQSCVFPLIFIESINRHQRYVTMIPGVAKHLLFMTFIRSNENQYQDNKKLQNWNVYANVICNLAWFHNFDAWLNHLAATKQLYEWYFLSVRLSVCLSVRHTFLTMIPLSYHYESYYIQELLPMTEVMSMQKVKVIGQRSRSQRS